MFGVFQAKPDTHPFRVVPVTTDLNEKNVATAWGGEESAAMNFAKEDAVDDLLLNRVDLARREGSQPPDARPRPRRVRARRGDDD
jgi:hypothetical protein